MRVCESKPESLRCPGRPQSVQARLLGSSSAKHCQAKILIEDLTKDLRNLLKHSRESLKDFLKPQLQLSYIQDGAWTGSFGFLAGE